MEQQVASTEPQQTPQAPQTPQGTEPQQVQSTVEPQGQPPVTEPTPEVDLSKIDLSKATPEQLAEIQKGYMRNADYTQKTQELATEKGKPVDYDALMNDQNFIQWAANKQASLQQPTQATTEQQQAEEEKIAAMTEAERTAYYVKKEMAPIAQSYYQDRQATQDEKLVGRYGEVYNPYIPKIAQLQQTIAKNPNLYREEAFKILDYEAAQQRAKEIGRQEALQGNVQRQNANMTQESAPSLTQREVIRGPGSLQKIFQRAEGEGRTA